MAGAEDECNSEATQGADFQRKLFDVPENCEFPLEISCHLKEKLHGVLEQNWHLKRHLDYLDKEVIELRKYRAEHRDKCGRSQEADYSNSSTTIMAQRIVELSKKNRDLCSQTEGMKTKIGKLVRENESLRNMVECFREKDIPEDVLRQASNMDSDLLSTTTPGSQQNAQLTNKVIEYRRQNQLLRMELKTALRALSQEVGDGATPHGVLNMTNGSGAASWRGRQQQIIALQQKVSELQVKLKETFVCNGDQESEVTNGAGDADTYFSQQKLNSTTGHRNALVLQDKKKQEQIEKLTQNLEQTTMELKSCQNELKASKARIHNLENQIKTFKSHIEILDGKLTEGEKASELHEKEMKQIRQETANLKERDRRYRDQTSLELQEGQRALQRERAIVMRLQNVIQEKQDAIQKQDAEIIGLRNKLEISCSGAFGGNVDVVDRFRQIEGQLENATKVIEAGEHERKSLLKMMQEYLSQAEEERQKYILASEHSARISCVLKRADQCISECLDAGQVTSEDILQEVEHIRTLIRELKLGDLYVYENVQHKDMTKKLTTQVEMLKQEVAKLKCVMKELSNARRKDLQNFAAISDQLKSEWEDAIKTKQISTVFSR